VKLLICLNTLTTGGAELFAIRLANEFSRRGVNVYLFNFREDKTEDFIINKIDKSVQIIHAFLPLVRYLEKLDGLIFKVGTKWSIINYLLILQLKRLIQDKNIDVIHSHLYNVDKIVVLLKKSSPQVKVVSTMHGDYEANIKREMEGHKIYREQNFHCTRLHILKKIDDVVCITNNQVTLLKELKHSEGLNFNLHKIYNGYEDNITNQKCRFSISSLGIKETDFIYGMVSRGLAEKGWERAIKAFIRLESTNNHLLLIGSSPHLNDLEKKYQSHRNIHFLGSTGEVIPIIKNFDVALFPSFYEAESLPTVIIEYLLCEVPIISSDIGEIKNMIKTKEGFAGHLVKLENEEFVVQEFSNAMKYFKENKELLNIMRLRAAEAFKKFTLGKCVDAYYKIFSN